jgi:hypothetical protein
VLFPLAETMKPEQIEVVGFSHHILLKSHGASGFLLIKLPYVIFTLGGQEKYRKGETCRIYETLLKK